MGVKVTPEQFEFFKAKFERGEATVAELAEEAGVCRLQMWSRLKAAGVSPIETRRKREAMKREKRIVEALRLLAEGVSMTSAAQRCRLQFTDLKAEAARRGVQYELHRYKTKKSAEELASRRSMERGGKHIYGSRLLAEQKLGRPLRDTEIAVYADGNWRNESLDNILIFPSRSAASAYITRQRHERERREAGRNQRRRERAATKKSDARREAD